MAIPIGEFFDLYEGQRYTGSLALGETCPRYCLDETQLGRCDNQCECAMAREVVAVVRERFRSARSHLSPTLVAG